MTAIPQPSSLSDRLTGPLREVARRQWYVLAVVGAMKTLIAGLVTLLAAALLLGFFHSLWMPVRIALALIAWAVVIGSAVRFLRPALRRWSLSRAAMQVEHHQPALQERLSSAIELSNDREPAFRGSASLIAHLVGQAEADARNVRPEQVVPTDRIMRWFLLLVPVLLLWVGVSLMQGTSKTAMRGLFHVLMPWKDLPAMLTQVAVKPGDITLIQGDPLDVTAHVTFDSGNDREVGHATLIRTFENGQRLTDDMEKAGPHDYRLHFDDLQQTFSYKVTTDQGDSEWFKATVHPRPQINSIDIRCDYPAYTGMSATVVPGKEGLIEALVGTRVTITVHTALPVVTDKSRIVVDENTPEQLVLPLRQTAPDKAEYEAQLIVNHSGEYKINLTNEFDLTNKDEQPRSIVAQPDEVPTIVIRSPEPQVTVRPDDTVPVKYLANDDFGVAKIEAILQVDDHAPQTVPVPFKTSDKRTVTDPAFPIDVAAVLKSLNLNNADHITYQLKVTDNRDPDPQSSFSNKQTLKINKNEYTSFQSKEDKKLAKDLTQAIEKAIRELNQEEQHMQPAKDVDARQRLETHQRAQLHEATREIPKTGRELKSAADEARDSIFQDVAKQLEKIATKPIRTAAEDAAQADLNAENGNDRKDSASRAVAEITDARNALQKLLEKQAIQKDEHAAEAARDLAEAARKQQDAAELMKPRPQDSKPQTAQATQQQAEAMHKQEQANQKLRQAMEQSEALRDPKAQETAQKLEDLIRKVEETQKQQDAGAEQNEKQQAVNDIQEKANEIAQKQEALNKDVQQAAEQHKEALQKANAQAPNKDQQNEIVKNLDRNQLQQAHEQMKQAAQQLHQEAQQLHNQAKSNDLKPDQKQQEAINKDQQAAQNAQNEQNQAHQAAEALKQEAQQNAVPKGDDQAIKNAEQAAREIQKEAADLHPQNADAQQAADAARQDAQAAENAAEQAAQAPNPQEAQKDLSQAAQELNKAAQELADAAKKDADADKAQMVKAQQQEAQAAADQADAQAAQHDALAKAIEAEQNDLAKAQQNEQQPDQTAQQEKQVAEQAKSAAQQADQLQHQAQEAKNPNVAKRAEEAKADLAQAQEHAAQAAQAEQQAAQEQQKAANAQNAQEAKAAEQNADKALEQAANQQQQAQDALAKAESDLRNLPAQDAQANADQPQGTPEQAQADAGQDQGEKGQGSPQQQAAQAAQEAAQAQQEASQQNPAAAREAARALAQAAQQMARAVPGLHPEQGQEPGQEPGTEPGQEPSQHAGKTPDSKQGIQPGAAPVSLPASVRDIGITADQWAKLPPLARKDLMNAAQQSGPPSYRQMIKDYYVRIAKMEQPSAAPAQ